MATKIETQTILRHRSPMADDDSNQLRLCLEYQGRRYAFVWKGIDVACRPLPTIRRVLENFHMSCASDTSNFEAWCNDFGYDPDRISSWKTFQAVKREQANIRRLFGSDYQRFLEIEFED